MGGTFNIILLIVVILVVLFVLTRGREVSSRVKDSQKRAAEVQKQNAAEIEKAQAKRDAQISLLKELVALEKQSIENQQAILELLHQK